MADDDSAREPTAERVTSPASENERATEFPAVETDEPDLMPPMMSGRIGAGGLTLVALFVAFVIFVVFYGINSGATP